MNPARRLRRRRLVAVASALALATAIALLFSVVGPWSNKAASGFPDEAFLPAPPAPAVVVPRPRPLRDRGMTGRWAAVRLRVPARAAPTPRALVVAELAMRTPEGTANIVSVLGNARLAAGRLWVQARVPGLDGRTGWIPRAALGGYHVVRTRLVVDLQRLTATLYDAGRKVFEAPVGIGRVQWPTPRGEFYVRDRLRTLDTSFYGPLAFGTSARSAVLTDWPGGGFIGIHGTSRPGILPGRVSHGCIRLRNEDILELGRLMPVGTPLSIV